MAQSRYTLGATGLKFQIGDSLRPKRDDVVAALVFLEKHDMARFLWPTQHERVNSMSMAQIHQVVPECLANSILIKYKLDDPLKAALWIVAWYNHMWLGGVRPSTAERAPRIFIAAKAYFRCPLCGEPYFPPSRVVNQDAAIRSFGTWLATHSKVKYHKGKQTTRLPRKFDPDPTKGTQYRAKKLARKRRNPEPEIAALLAQFKKHAGAK